jgi:hypothetical protein
MRFAETALTDDNNRPALSFVHGFDSLQNVMGRVGNVQELRRCDLHSAGAAVVRQFYDRPLQSGRPEFFTQ